MSSTAPKITLPLVVLATAAAFTAATSSTAAPNQAAATHHLEDGCEVATDRRGALTDGSGRLRLLIAVNKDPVARTVAARRSRSTSGLETMPRRDVQAALVSSASARRPLVRAVTRSGGAVCEEIPLGANAVIATLPSQAAQAITRRPDVSDATRAPHVPPASIESSSAAVGASVFWQAGYLGGQGPNDTNPADLAITQDKIQQDHPAFSGIDFQTAPGATADVTSIFPFCGASAHPQCDHGTAVASLAIAGGTAAFPNEIGIARAPDTVLDAHGRTPCGTGINNGAWALGYTLTFADCPGQPVPGATDPAEVFSTSAGSYAGPEVDDSLELRITDNTINLGGISHAIAAGNEGPGQAVATPCIAYNSLCVGAFDPNGTVTPSDDTISAFSSRGPTPAGRKKPDLVAVGVPGSYANRRWAYPSQPEFTTGLTGTSFAAPQAAGALTLLAGSGVTDPLAQKAILINSARPGRATPSDPMGSQVGWNPDWGWGALDLAAAFDQRTNFATGSASAKQPRFFAGTLNEDDRTTLTWNRSTTGCIGPGCQPAATSLTNLDLRLRGPDTGTLVASSESSIDNVEQTRAPAAEPVIVVVADADDESSPVIPFALASATPLTPLETPSPTIDLAAAPAAARQNTDIVVTATVRNPSSDLAAEGIDVTLDLPAGITLAGGSPPATQTIAELGPDDTDIATWTVRGTIDGLKRLAVSTTATALTETIAGASATTDVLVDSTAPKPAISVKPTGPSPTRALVVNWSATDGGAGVASYDLEEQVDGGAFAALANSTKTTSRIISVAPGKTYRYRVRARDQLGNLSTYVASGLTAIPGVGPPTPTPISRDDPRLRIVAVRKVGRRVTVRGRISPRASRQVAVTYRLLARRRPAATRYVRQIRGRFIARLRLPSSLARLRKAVVILRYPGDAKLRKGRLSRSLASRPGTRVVGPRDGR